jgi:septal ring factor EnvC (AmiA/AmiB activator)
MLTPMDLPRIASQIVSSPAWVPAVRTQVWQGAARQSDPQRDLMLLVAHIAKHTEREVKGLIDALRIEIENGRNERERLGASMPKYERKLAGLDDPEAKAQLREDLDTIAAQIEQVARQLEKLQRVIEALQRLLPAIMDAAGRDAGSPKCSPSPQIVSARIATLLKYVGPVDLAVAPCSGQSSASVRSWLARFRFLLSELPRLFNPVF